MTIVMMCHSFLFWVSLVVKKLPFPNSHAELNAAICLQWRKNENGSDIITSTIGYRIHYDRDYRQDIAATDIGMIEVIR